MQRGEQGAGAAEGSKEELQRRIKFETKRQKKWSVEKETAINIDCLHLFTGQTLEIFFGTSAHSFESMNR